MEEPSQKSHVVASGILAYLKESRQIDLLRAVTEQLEKVSGKTRRARHIVVTSVIPITPSQKQMVLGMVKKTLGLSLPIVNKIDKSILGGLTVRVGDWSVDATIAGALDRVSETIRA